MADHEYPQVNPKVRQGARLFILPGRGADGYDVPRRPVWAVRALGVAAVIVGCAAYQADAVDAPVPHPLSERPVAEGGPEAVMAQHDCGPHVDLMESQGAVVSVGGAPTYVAGTEAAGQAYTDAVAGDVHLYGFCAR